MANELCPKCGSEMKHTTSLDGDSFWCQDCRIAELDAALAQVSVLRDTIRIGIATLPHIGADPRPTDGLLARFGEALSNTSATAQETVQRIEREALEKAIQRLNSSVGVTWRIPDDLATRIRAAILGEKGPE